MQSTKRCLPEAKIDSPEKVRLSVLCTALLASAHLSRRPGDEDSTTQLAGPGRQPATVTPPPNIDTEKCAVISALVHANPVGYRLDASFTAEEHRVSDVGSILAFANGRRRV